MLAVWTICWFYVIEVIEINKLFPYTCMYKKILWNSFVSSDLRGNQNDESYIWWKPSWICLIFTIWVIKVQLKTIIITILTLLYVLNKIRQLPLAWSMFLVSALDSHPSAHRFYCSIRKVKCELINLCFIMQTSRS